MAIDDCFWGKPADVFIDPMVALDVEIQPKVGDVSFAYSIADYEYAH